MELYNTPPLSFTNTHTPSLSIDPCIGTETYYSDPFRLTSLVKGLACETTVKLPHMSIASPYGGASGSTDLFSISGAR